MKKEIVKWPMILRTMKSSVYKYKGIKFPKYSCSFILFLCSIITILWERKDNNLADKLTYNHLHPVPTSVPFQVDCDEVHSTHWADKYPLSR